MFSHSFTVDKTISLSIEVPLTVFSSFNKIGASGKIARTSRLKVFPNERSIVLTSKLTPAKEVLAGTIFWATFSDGFIPSGYGLLITSVSEPLKSWKFGLSPVSKVIGKFTPGGGGGVNNSRLSQ